MAARISDYFTPDILLPAVSQGAIAVQLRSGDERVGKYVRALEHATTRATTTAERALLRTVEGGCQVPVGAHATVDGEMLTLSAVICSLDGSESVAGESRGRVSEARSLGEELGRELLGRGGSSILAGIRSPSDAL